MSRLSIILASTVLVLGLGWATTRVFATPAAANSADASMPQAGQAAPTFTLPSQDGTPTSLSAFKGKWVVLYFYPKDMTSGCTLEAHNFQQDAEKYQKMNAVIVGVSVDTVDSHKQFCAKEGLNFKLLSDADKKVVVEYGSLGNYMGIKIAKRNTFLISPEGKIVKVWTGVDPKTHSAEVLAELSGDEKKG
jgi:peroxiredoxin Q/BCP